MPVATITVFSLFFSFSLSLFTFSLSSWFASIITGLKLLNIVAQRFN